MHFYSINLLTSQLFSKSSLTYAYESDSIDIAARSIHQSFPSRLSDKLLDVRSLKWLNRALFVSEFNRSLGVPYYSEVVTYAKNALILGGLFAKAVIGVRQRNYTPLAWIGGLIAINLPRYASPTLKKIYNIFDQVIGCVVFIPNCSAIWFARVVVINDCIQGALKLFEANSNRNSEVSTFEKIYHLFNEVVGLGMILPSYRRSWLTRIVLAEVCVRRALQICKVDITPNIDLPELKIDGKVCPKVHEHILIEDRPSKLAELTTKYKEISPLIEKINKYPMLRPLIYMLEEIGITYNSRDSINDILTVPFDDKNLKIFTNKVIRQYVFAIKGANNLTKLEKGQRYMAAVRYEAFARHIFVELLKFPISPIQIEGFMGGKCRIYPSFKQEYEKPMSLVLLALVYFMAQLISEGIGKYCTQQRLDWVTDQSND